MLEKRIEGALKTTVERYGAKVRKFVSSGWVGVPDRIVLIPGGRVVFVELKAPAKSLKPFKKKRTVQLQALGFPVYHVDSIAAVKKFAAEVFNGEGG
jgi:hypothetical protein